MAKHRRFSDKPKDSPIKKEEEIELVEEISSPKTSMNIKTISIKRSLPSLCSSE